MSSRITSKLPFYIQNTLKKITKDKHVKYLLHNCNNTQKQIYLGCGNGVNEYNKCVNDYLNIVLSE